MKPFYFLVMALFCLCPSIQAQSPEEMRMLELFYEEKDLVISATRYPKPIHQVAENITVIYSEEIEAMNAHSVAEVLRWIPGVFVNSSQDFGATSIIGIQGSEDRHVTVLLDGVRWNYLSGGNAETNTIPVGIIDRIEVIKGPASSAWGSALGGVVNIITKPAAEKESKGRVYASYGKSSSLDARAEAFGSGEIFGYYLYAGMLESDGLLDDRSMENSSLFSKFNVTLSKDADLNISLGYSRPENDLGSFAGGNVRSYSRGRTVYANAALDIDISPRSILNFTGYYISQDVNFDNKILPTEDPFLNTNYQEKTYGANARIVWEPAHQTLVVGAEINRGDLLQVIGAPALTESNPDILSWAVYINDTLSLDRWAVTPGVRLDHNTVSGLFFSPSLGATFQPKTSLLFRATISRGFHYPPLSLTEGGGFLLDPNSDLEAEEVWSYQAGIETTALPRMRVKTTLFLHDLDEELTRELKGGGPPSDNDLMINSGGLQRRGVEIDLNTDSFHYFSIEVSGIYVHFNQQNSVGATESFAYNLILSYNNPIILNARLSGHYEDPNAVEDYDSNFNDIIWDLNVSKGFSFGNNTEARVFVTGHNLFDDDQYLLGDTRNPGRWFEGGIKFAF